MSGSLLPPLMATSSAHQGGMPAPSHGSMPAPSLAPPRHGYPAPGAQFGMAQPQPSAVRPGFPLPTQGMPNASSAGTLPPHSSSFSSVGTSSSPSSAPPMSSVPSQPPTIGTGGYGNQLSGAASGPGGAFRPSGPPAPGVGFPTHSAMGPGGVATPPGSYSRPSQGQGSPGSGQVHIPSGPGHQGQFLASTTQGQFPSGPNQAQFPPGAKQGHFPPGPNQGHFPPGPNQGQFPRVPGQGQFPHGPGQGQFPTGPGGPGRPMDMQNSAMSGGHPMQQRTTQEQVPSPVRCLSVLSSSLSLSLTQLCKRETTKRCRLP